MSLRASHFRRPCALVRTATRRAFMVAALPFRPMQRWRCAALEVLFRYLAFPSVSFLCFPMLFGSHCHFCLFDGFFRWILIWFLFPFFFSASVQFEFELLDVDAEDDDATRRLQTALSATELLAAATVLKVGRGGRARVCICVHVAFPFSSFVTVFDRTVSGGVELNATTMRTPHPIVDCMRVRPLAALAHILVIPPFFLSLRSAPHSKRRPSSGARVSIARRVVATRESRALWSRSPRRCLRLSTMTLCLSRRLQLRHARSPPQQPTSRRVCLGSSSVYSFTSV